MKKKKKQSTGLIVAAVLLGVVDVAAFALLLAGVLISPAKGETVKAELSANFQENDQEYYDVDWTENYPSTATVAYGGTAIIGDAPDTNDTSDTENLTEDDDDTIDTSDDPYAGFVFPDSDTTIITKTQMKATLKTRSLCRRAVNEIYARHGYQFSKQENTDYFNQYDWYRNMPKETDMSIVASEFSSVEKKNVEALQAYEDSKDWD